MTEGGQRILIVGASLAGARTAMSLRRRGYDGEIVVVGAEPHRPYDRPPLSKQLLAGEWEPDRIRLQRPERYEEDDIELRLGVRAVALDPGQRQVELDDGTTASADAVVLATGAVARRLPAQPALDGLFTLRTLDDSLALRDALDTGPRVAVIGAGFIGCEVAATARGRGLAVTVLEALEAPMVRGVGPAIGRVLAQLHRDQGVDMRCGVQVAAIEGDGRVEGVRLADGEVVPADLVLVGIGATPATGWLEGSGLALDDGVVCDRFGRAVGAKGVWALGDVARWDHPLVGGPVRVEHWTSAIEQAEVVAQNLLAGDGALTANESVPFVWSDQYGRKIQVLGRPGPDDTLHVVEGEVASGEFAAVYHRDGALTGAIGIARPRPVMMLRRFIAGGAGLDEALARLAG